MPNGHVHYEACDILHWRFTEQTYPTVLIDRFDYSRGLRLVQLRGVRGYAPDPDLRTWKYWHYPERHAQRSNVEQFAETCIAATRDLLLSNPKDPLDPKARFAELAWLWFEPGWAVIAGLDLYVRDESGPLRPVTENPFKFPADMTEEQREFVQKYMSNIFTGITTSGLAHPNMSASSCVVDFRECSEVLVSSVRLQDTPIWPEIANLSVFDPRAAGLLVNVFRLRGHERECDQFAVRWKRPAK